MKYLNDISYKDCVGKVCVSKSSGDFKILKYNNKTNVEILFLKTGYETSVQLTNIRNGNVKDPYLPSVCGIGITGAKYPTKVNDVRTKEYVLWQSMLQRCYSDTDVCGAFKKKHPTYIDCEVSDKFKSYEYFYEWCHSQIGFGNEGWHLDKDLLVKGNKVYSENTCVFIPQEVNSLLVKSTASRGKHLIGVYWNKRNKAFVAQVCKSKGKRDYLGLFKTELEAFNAYKQAKEAFIKEQANKWKGKIDDRAYEALMSYEVNIDD
jgi:hypothetical protein